jgi:hypothetical protein
MFLEERGSFFSRFWPKYKNQGSKLRGETKALALMATPSGKITPGWITVFAPIRQKSEKEISFFMPPLLISGG